MNDVRLDRPKGLSEARIPPLQIPGLPLKAQWPEKDAFEI
jgi:hypothetical protein